MESPNGVTLPIQCSAFVLETNHRYLFVSGAGDHFKIKVAENDIGIFLSGVREYFLNHIAEEMIRLKIGKQYG